MPAPIAHAVAHEKRMVAYSIPFHRLHYISVLFIIFNQIPLHDAQWAEFLALVVFEFVHLAVSACQRLTQCHALCLHIRVLL